MTTVVVAARFLEYPVNLSMYLIVFETSPSLDMGVALSDSSTQLDPNSFLCDLKLTAWNQTTGINLTINQLTSYLKLI